MMLNKTTSLSPQLERQPSTSQSLAARSQSRHAKGVAEIEDNDIKMFGQNLHEPSKMESVTSEGKLIYLKNHKKWSKYLRGNEESLTEEELKKRKKQHFLNKLFYKKLCTLVDRIKNFQNSAQPAEQKAIERRRIRQEEIKKEKEQYKRRMREMAKERESKSKPNPGRGGGSSPEYTNDPQSSYLNLLNSRTTSAKPRGMTVIAKRDPDMRSASKREPLQSSRNLNNPSHKDDLSYISPPSSRKAAAVGENGRMQMRLKKSQTKQMSVVEAKPNVLPRRSTTENFDHEGLMIAYKTRTRLTEAKKGRVQGMPSSQEVEKPGKKGNVDLISINSIDSSSEDQSSDDISSHDLSNSSQKKASARRRSKKPSKELVMHPYATPQPILGKPMHYHVIEGKDTLQENKKDSLPCTREGHESGSNDEVEISKPPIVDITKHLKGKPCIRHRLTREVFMNDLRPSFGKICMHESFKRRLITLEEKYGTEVVPTTAPSPRRRRRLKSSTIKKSLLKKSPKGRPSPHVETGFTSGLTSAFHSFVTSPIATPLDFTKGLNLKARMTKYTLKQDQKLDQAPLEKPMEDDTAIQTNCTSLRKRTFGNRVLQQTMQDDSPPPALATTTAIHQPFFFSFDNSSQIIRTSEVTESGYKDSRTSKHSAWVGRNRLASLRATKNFIPILSDKHETIVSGERPLKARKQHQPRSRQIRPQTATSIQVFNGEFHRKSVSRRYEGPSKRFSSKAVPLKCLILKGSEQNLDMVTPTTINLEQTQANSSSNYQTAPRTKSQQGKHFKDVKSSISSVGPKINATTEGRREGPVPKRLSIAGRRGYTGRIAMKKSSVVAVSNQWTLC